MNTKNTLIAILILLSPKLFGQIGTIEITGKILSEGQNALDSVKVSYSKENFTYTDRKGSFKLIVPNEFPIKLSYSAKGFNNEERLIGSGSELPVQIRLTKEVTSSEVIVSGRRRNEVAQDIPIPITVISGATAEETGAFNVNRLKELVPSVQLYSSNARNTTLNIRGLGSTFGLTNDGLDPGVGFYIDGVYHARPAATALDFIDIEQIEILRGPQGTLFGKNTTSGAFNITSKKPTEETTAKAELSYGNYNFFQAKTSVSGKVAKNLTTRVSFSATQRQGTIFNTYDQQNYNGLNNIGVKGQLYYTPTEKLSLQLIGDYNDQKPDGSSLVIAGVTTTQRSKFRQYYSIIEDLGYQRPVIDPFSRRINTNTPWKHNQSIGGVSLNADYKIGEGTLTSTSAWRFWNWDPVNDRDFSEVSALTKSQAPSRHDQYSQELRYSGKLLDVFDGNLKIDGTIGAYYLNQTLETSPYHEEEVGSDQWRFVQRDTTSKDSLLSTPGLLDNFGVRTYSKILSESSAGFGQLDVTLAKVFHLIGGLRYNYDRKSVDFDRQTYGGLQTTNKDLLNLKKSVYSNQKFNASTTNEDLSGNLTIGYQPNHRLNVFATYSTAYKPVGVNVGGLPTLDNGDPNLDLAVIKPEYTQHLEFGIKTKPFKGAILNFVLHNSDISNYQTNVQSPQLGVNRGYLANAEKVNVKGFEVDASYQYKNILSLTGSVAYTDGRYVKFTNAPLPLEETGATTKDPVTGKNVQLAYKDISGGVLPGISKWNSTLGAELSTKGTFLGKLGRFFIGSELSYRSEYSSNPSPSKVLTIDGYTLLNARVGFRSNNVSFSVWSRNLANTNYFEQLQAAAGNSGLYGGVLGDPRTYGVTLKYTY
jgi:iron complex outermembrane receptor protein